MAQLHIGDALKNFLNTSKLKSGLISAQIESIWEEVMGRTIARHTSKVELINTTLFIYTTEGALRQELIYLKPKIIERINEALHESVITDVIVK